MATDTKTVLRLQQIQDAWWRWFATMRLIVADCQSNEDLMRGILGQVLQGDPIPLELQSHENIWIVAFTHCRRHGLLEVPPPPETPEARNRRLAAKDRYDGYAGNKDTDPTTVLERQAKERRDRIAAEKKAAEESAKAAAAKAAADADLSGVPTVAQIVAGEAKPFGELSAKEIHAMSSAQLKRYTQNSHSALIEKENVRVAEKRARIKERANA